MSGNKLELFLLEYLLSQDPFFTSVRVKTQYGQLQSSHVIAVNIDFDSVDGFNYTVTLKSCDENVRILSKELIKEVKKRITKKYYELSKES